MKIRSYILILSYILIAISSCAPRWHRQLRTSDNLKKDSIILEPDIAQKPVYKKLDKETEVDFAFLDTTPKPRTSNVFYINNRNHKLNDTTSARAYHCKTVLKDDTLWIHISIESLFTGEGFNVKYSDGLYTIEPFHSDDTDTQNDPISYFYVNEQNLVLNKADYAVGDSIYGKVHFYITEICDKKKITHIADGYFRGKVKDDF